MKFSWRMGLCISLLALPAAAEVLLDDGESVEAWSGEAIKTLSPDAKVGEGCLQITLTSAMSAYPALSRPLPFKDWSQYDVLTFWIKADVPTAYFQTVLHDHQGTLSERGLPEELPAGRWRFFVWPYRTLPGWVHGAHSTFNYGEVGTLRFYIERPVTPGAEVTFWIDDIRLMTMEELRHKLSGDPAARVGNAALLWAVLPQPEPDRMVCYFSHAAARRLEPLIHQREAHQLAERVRRGLLASLRPEEYPPCPPDPQVVGTVEGEGFVIEKVLLQTLPGVRMPILVYRPAASSGRIPAILRLPGHAEPPYGWQVQQQGISLARRGYLYAAVEVWGAGERGEIVPAACAHGGLPADALWPTGASLFGLVLTENQRALDYLISRPDVDPERIGVTGASGGGTHTLWLMAVDSRVKAAVAVASGLPDPASPLSGHCECDLPWGFFGYGGDQEVIAALAPRPLLRIYPSGDTLDLTEEQLRQQHRFAASAYRAWGAAEQLRVARLEGLHGYYVNYQEAALGWFDCYLKGQGDGSPRPLEAEPFFFQDDTPLRFFPNLLRPLDFMRPSQFLSHRIHSLATALPAPPARREEWERLGAFLKERLTALLTVLSPQTESQDMPMETVDGCQVQRLLLSPEPELRLPAVLFQPPESSGKTPLALLLHPEGKGATADRPLRSELVQRGWAVLVADLRGTGETRAAEWEVGAYLNQRDMAWAKAAARLGRSALSMWLTDLTALVNALARREDVDLTRLSLYGYGETGTAALFFGALDGRPSTVVVERALGSYLSESGFGRPFLYQEPSPTAAAGGGIGSMVPFVPDLLKVADLPQVAALWAPRRLVIIDALRGDGRPMDYRYARQQYAFTAAVYALTGGRFEVVDPQRDADLAEILVGNK